MVAPAKACNFSNIRLHHGCISVNFQKLFEKHFDALPEFSKSSQKYLLNNTCEKIFAKYLSADACSVKTNNINCDDNDNAMFSNTRVLSFTRQPMKRNFP